MRLIDADAMNWGTCPTDGKLAKEWLDAHPTIEAHPVVRGEWRRCYDDSAGWVDMCDQCGEFGDETNFCPNCGADNRGDGDGRT